MPPIEYARNLDQTCHACGLTEAAGDYCTRCGARTVEDWHPGGSPAQRAALVKANAALAKARAARRNGPKLDVRGPNPGDHPDGGTDDGRPPFRAF